MYWVCVGGLVAFENVAQWLVSWYVKRSYFHTSQTPYKLRVVRFPFYWEARTILLLFLALPQIQVSRTSADRRHATFV